MSNIFIRPSYQHDVSRVSSATTESGLTVSQPIPDEGNSGTLRLRASGIPTAAASLDLQLQTGGNPAGYALTTGSGQGLGSALIWKKTTDSGAAGTLHWRGYIDTPYLVRVDYPVTYGTGRGKPSTPRTLPDGYLGFLTHHSPGTASALVFTRVSTANVASTSTVDATTATSSGQSDFVVLPSGRLVAVKVRSLSLTRYESDDYGATWSTGVACGQVSTNQDTVCLEYAEDVLTMVVSSSTGADPTEVRVSQDEGYNWSTVDDSQTLTAARTCVTTTGKILVISTATEPLVREIAPGGGLSTATVESDIACNSGFTALVARDDGTIWAFATRSTAANRVDLDCSVSVDGGLTFTSPISGGDQVFDINSTITNGGYIAISAGSWCGKVVILALSRSAGAGSDYAVHMLTLGGWESLTEGGAGYTTSTYDHCLLPVDLPDAYTTAWTRVNTAAGATVTNPGPLNFVSTALNNTYFLAPTAVLAASGAGETYRIRFRARCNSGGSTTQNAAGFRFSVSDGAGNHQGFILRLSSTGFRVVDVASTYSDSTTLDMTKVTDFFFAFKHDNVANTSGLLSFWYKQDADETWTLGDAVGVIGESAVAGNSQLRVGGSTGVACDWDCYFLGVADSSDGMENGFTNPDDLTGRSLASHADYYLTSGIHLGGYNAGGSKGDAYTFETTYNYGKEDVWRELRPSRHVRSTGDVALWGWVADAGATDLFRGDFVALFGTNFRTCTFQLNATDSWGAPSVEVSLDATITSFTPGVGNRGTGYVGPTASPNWRPGQFRSDGDGHRFFCQIGAVGTYEISDNDADRLYFKDVDCSASFGTCYIFGDRMGAPVPFSQYRYIRVYIGALLATADDHYRLGTVIFDRKFEPSRKYGDDFTDRITPNVVIHESDSGYSSRSRRGPRNYSTTIMWGPLDSKQPGTGDLLQKISDFYAAVEGDLTPIVWWRDTSDVTTLRLVYLEGILAAPNLVGELKDALARVDQLELVECL